MENRQLGLYRTIKQISLKHLLHNVSGGVHPSSEKQKLKFYSEEKFNLARDSKWLLETKWSQTGFLILSLKKMP